MGRRIISTITTKSIPIQPTFNVEFPEGLFPCHSDDYLYRKSIGLERTKEYSVCICGIVRDVESVIDINLKRLTNIGLIFKQYDIVIYESDSLDQTLNICLSAEKLNNNIHIFSEKLNLPRLYDGSLQRRNYLALIRNRLLNIIKTKFDYHDYIILVDPDFKGGWSIDGIYNSFGWWGWDCLTCNGIDLDYGYYDMFAFRKNHWDDSYIDLDQPKLSFKPGITRPKYKRGEALVKTFSSFGGMAIIPTNIYLQSFYSDEACDHVTFFSRLFTKGYNQVFINPSLIGIR